MIRIRRTSNLDGDFRFPVERFALRSEGKWIIVWRGARYVNQYEVVEHDEAGERWLKANDRTAALAAPASA